jgi:hypothetical protein
MNKIYIILSIILLSFSGVSSFADLVDCDWFNNNVVLKKNIISISRSFAGGNYRSFRIMHVQKQLGNKYLGIDYSLDPEMVDKSSADETQFPGAYVYCALASQNKLPHSKQMSLYLGFGNEFERALFYNLLISQSSIVLSLDGNRDEIKLEDLKITIENEEFSGSKLEAKLMEQIWVLYPDTAEKIIESIKAEGLKLSEVDNHFVNRAQNKLIDFDFLK